MQIEREIRKALGSTRRPHIEIAREADVHPVNLSKFLHGRTMKLDALCRLAPTLGLRIVVEKDPKQNR